MEKKELTNRKLIPLKETSGSVGENDKYNGALTEEIFYPNGSVDPEVVFRNYCIENQSTSLLLGDDLCALMRQCDVLFAMGKGRKSPFGFIYCTYLWSQVIKTQFDRDKPANKILDYIRNTFMEESLEYKKEDLDKHANFVQCMQESGLKCAFDEQFDDVPSILRILTPTNENIGADDIERKSEFLKLCLRELNREILLKPWKMCLEKKYQICGCHEEEVRKNKMEKLIIRKKLILLF